ncbi:MAG: hypothetical protein ACR2P1_12280 [Pseudomonadales bacterium]
MPANKFSMLLPSTAILACICALVFNFSLAGNAAAVTNTELQQERATLQAYERRIPRLLTQMRGLDRELDELQEQRQAIEQNLGDLTRTYLLKQRAHEQAQAEAAATDDKNTQAKLEHARFQYYLVERKLTNLQNEAEQLNKSIAPLKQRLQEKQRQLQQNEEGLAFQKEHVRKLASAAPTTVERIEIRSSNRNKDLQPELQASAAATAATVPAATPTSVTDTSKVEIATAQPLLNDDQGAIAEDRRYARAQAQRLQELLASGKPSKPSGSQPKTLEVQHKGSTGVKHFYDFAYAGADQYTTEGTVHAGKQVFKVARQRWVTNIPAYDDGANYVFILNATPHRRLELIMYNSALVE